MQRVVCVIIRNIMKKQTAQDDPEEKNRNMNSESKEKGEGLAQPRTKKQRGRGLLIAIGVIAALVLILFALYQIPAIHDRAYFHVTTLRSKIFYFLRPPAKSEFEISGETTMDAQVMATLTAFAPTATPTSAPEPTVAATSTAEAAVPPTATPLPTTIPAAVQLEGIVQEYQRFNSCGPANLVLNMRYWGWEGIQEDVEAVVKPVLQDLNVSPSELLEYVEGHTDLDAILRLGGDIDLLKKLVAAGYPVLAQRGYVNRDDGWMGHYGIVDGYDDAEGAVHIPDTFNGNIWLKYDEFQRVWDEFHGTYLVVFPPEEREIVLSILGGDADADYNLDRTFEKFRERAETVDRSEQYFAYYSLGELLVMKKQYVDAAAAFDQAFAVYGWLPVDDRPWRMLWYQVGPYEAYYYTGRYKDVVSITYKTIKDANTPALPETFLWSGRANIALGNTDTAIFDFKRALQWHPGWEPALAELEKLGVTP